MRVLVLLSALLAAVSAGHLAASRAYSSGGHAHGYDYSLPSGHARFSSHAKASHHVPTKALHYAPAKVHHYTHDTVTQYVHKPVVKVVEVPHTIIKEVPKVIVKEVIKEIIKDVPRYVIKEVPREVVREVYVPKVIVKTVEVPQTVVKHVPKVTVQTVEVLQTVVQHVPKTVVKTVEVPQVVVKHVPVYKQVVAAAPAPAVYHQQAVAPAPAVYHHQVVAPVPAAYHHQAVAPAPAVHHQQVPPVPVAAPAVYGAVAPAYPYVASVSSQFHAQDELGQYDYGYANPSSSKQEVKTADGIVRGGFSYVDANGKNVVASYYSDALGFHIARSDLPVAPVHTGVAPVDAAQPVQDTPEVAEAKVAHAKAHAEALAGASDAE